MRALKTAVLTTLLGIVGNASAMTYTLQVTGSGNLGGTSFTNAPVTIVLAGDTTVILTMAVAGSSYSYSLGTATVTVGGIGTQTFTDQMAIQVGYGAVWFLDVTLGRTVLDTSNSVYNTYSLAKCIGPLSGPSLAFADVLSSTTGGPFFFTGGAYSATFTAAATTCPVGSPCIIAPSDGASPQSQFVAISGTGTPGDNLDVLVGGFSVGQVQVDSEGNWEALPYVSLYGSSVTIQVQDQTSSNSSNTITVHPSLASFLPGPPNPPNSLTALLPLRKADILVTADPSSPQVLLFGATYTHTALYLGGDPNGTPMVAEAVTAAEAGASGQQVRSLPLEQTLAWASVTISGFRPRTPLAGVTRNAIVAWPAGVANQGLPFWSTADFALILGADVLFNASLGTLSPYFNSFLNAVNALKNSTSTFLCSTLVWRAYYEGTSHTLDISTPNLMSAQPGSLLASFSPAFIAQLDSVLLVPETLARNSPKLMQIF